MAYNCQNFKDGQRLTAECLNKIEQGIVDAAPDDSSVCDKSWSSRNTIDKLCPTFAKADAMVTCMPVAGYPLDIEWNRKNLLNNIAESKTTNGITFTVNEDKSVTINGTSTKEIFLHCGVVTGVDGASYTLSGCIASGSGKTYALYVYTGGNYFYDYGNSVSFEATERMSCYFLIREGVTFDNAVIKPMIRLAGSDSSYEPYLETTTISHCGKNLLDVSEDKMKAVSWIKASGERSKEFYGFELILPPGSYVMKAYPASTYTEGYLYGQVSTIDGTYLHSWHPVYGPTLAERPVTFTEWVKVFIYDAGTAIEDGAYKATSILLFKRFNIQIEVGSVATAFEPYVGSIYALDGTVCAVPGINTLWPYTGSLFVTGREAADSVVKYTAQNLSSDQRMQVRDNIGAADASTVPGKKLKNGCEVFNDIDNNVCNGVNAHAEGKNTTSSGTASHSEGDTTTAAVQGAHSEGIFTKASGNGAHAEGMGNDANANRNLASGNGAHAEGRVTKATASGAHSEGVFTEAIAEAAHAEGKGAIAASAAQHAQGKYNIKDATGKYAHIVGNGTASKRSNAHTLDWSGNAWYAGNVEGTDFVIGDPASNPLNSFKGMQNALGSDIIVINPAEAGTLILQENTYYQFLGTSTKKTLNMYDSNDAVYKTMTFQVLTIYCGSMTDSAKYDISQNMPTANLMAIGNDTGFSALSGAEVYCAGFRKNWPNTDDLNEVFRAEVSYPAGSWIIMQTKTSGPLPTINK